MRMVYPFIIFFVTTRNKIDILRCRRNVIIKIYEITNKFIRWLAAKPPQRLKNVKRTSCSPDRRKNALLVFLIYTDA